MSLEIAYAAMGGDLETVRDAYALVVDSIAII